MCERFHLQKQVYQSPVPFHKEFCDDSYNAERKLLRLSPELEMTTKPTEMPLEAFWFRRHMGDLWDPQDSPLSKEPFSKARLTCGQIMDK